MNDGINTADIEEMEILRDQDRERELNRMRVRTDEAIAQDRMQQQIHDLTITVNMLVERLDPLIQYAEEMLKKRNHLLKVFGK
jgi:uncharacterized protein YigA (DUF484 family)